MLTVQEIFLSVGLIGVLAGWLMGRAGSWFGNRSSRTRDEELNHRIRALEADLRVAQRKAEDATTQFDHQRQEVDALHAQTQTGSDTVRQHEELVQKLRRSLAEECAKTQSLRQELTNRAEETVRARAKVKEVETELGVARAGSDQVLEQMNQLAAERAELTGKLQSLQGELAGNRGGKQATVTRLPVRDSASEG